MIKVRPLVGFKSLRALNVFHTLILGLKLLPAYRGEGYETFLAAVQDRPPEEQEKLIREAVLFVELQQEEVESLVTFCEDPNGIAYSAASLKNMAPLEIAELIVAVCKEIAKIKIDLIGETEKKN